MPCLNSFKDSVWINNSCSHSDLTPSWDFTSKGALIRTSVVSAYGCTGSAVSLLMWFLLTSPQVFLGLVIFLRLTLINVGQPHNSWKQLMTIAWNQSWHRGCMNAWMEYYCLLFWGLGGGEKKGRDVEQKGRLINYWTWALVLCNILYQISPWSFPTCLPTPP